MASPEHPELLLPPAASLGQGVCLTPLQPVFFFLPPARHPYSQTCSSTPYSSGMLGFSRPLFQALCLSDQLSWLPLSFWLGPLSPPASHSTCGGQSSAQDVA